MSDDNAFRQGQSVVTEILNFDIDRKHNLVEVYDDILQLANGLQEESYLLQELETEFGDFQNEIPNFKEILLDEECPIVIAGETSAGKSSFINLLIGSDILPVSLLACTSTIVKIHNATKKEIRITGEQGDKTIITIYADADSETIKKVVTEYVTIKGKLNCKCVDIYLPVPMLKGNTVIVDTPGIGTSANPELTARLFEFLPRAVAFIYIIDAGHAGGLEADRLLAIFEEQRKLKQSGKMIEFDVSRTIFVCNKWDRVEDEDLEDDVFDHVRQTLHKCWPNFDEKQMFLLSVKQEKELAKQQKISKNYQKLLLGIEQLIPNSLEAKSVINARWQHDFLQKLIERIYSRIQLSRKNQTERQELNQTAEKRLSILRTNISKVMEKVIINAEMKCTHISTQACIHINNQETKKKTFQWKNEELLYEQYPNEPIKSIGQMKLRGQKLIQDCVEKELKMFLQKEKVEQLGYDFEKMLLEELQLIDEQSKKVKELILNYRIPNNEYKVLKNIAYATVGLIGLPVLIPIGVVCLIALPFRLNKDVFISLIEKHSMDDFKSKPIEIMNKWAEKVLPYYSQKMIYSRLECEYINSFKQKVRHVCGKIIPQQIEADTIFIQNVTQDIRSYVEIRSHYLPFGKKAKAIMGKLLIVYMEYFPHYSGSSVISRNCTYANIMEGRFANVDDIEMLSGQKWVKAVVKTMKQTLETDVSLIQLTDVDSIRNINHQNIVQIYGTSIGIDQSSNKHLKLCMEHVPESLESMILKNRDVVPCCKFEDWNNAGSKKSKDFFIRTMAGVSSGLAHLHEEGFIHRDLKMSNVFIKDEVAKIADAGLLQPNEHTYTANGAYMPTTVAPEMLSEEYCETKESDIYSLGILMWEVYYCRPAFTLINNEDSELTSFMGLREDYRFEVTDALELIDRVQTGHRPTFEKYQPVQELIELVSQCWSGNMDTRPTAEMVAAKLGELNNS